MKTNERVDITKCDLCDTPIFMDRRQLCGGVAVSSNPFHMRRLPTNSFADLHFCNGCLTAIRTAKVEETSNAPN